MFEQYLPKKFCREFVNIKDSDRQLIMFMAVVLGIKPAMDDWIPKKRLIRFINLCRKYGLKTKKDIAFSDIDNPNIKTATGGETLTTTIAKGVRISLANELDMVHIFISKSKDNLDKAFVNGWYPVMIKNRVMQKPYIDLLKFGYGLGYPDCCIKFFRHFNDWRKYSHLFEIFKNTKGDPSFLCNPFTKDMVYSYIYHMPCSFNCTKTIDLTGKLREAIKSKEPELVKKIDEHLKIPFLIFYETVMYAFKGEIRNNRLYYNQVYFVARFNKENPYQKKLEKGNCLFVENRKVIILKNGKNIATINCPKKDWANKEPFLIQFK